MARTIVVTIPDSWEQAALFYKTTPELQIKELEASTIRNALAVHFETAVFSGLRRIAAVDMVKSDKIKADLIAAIEANLP